jgi:hypothetical protein
MSVPKWFDQWTTILRPSDGLFVERPRICSGESIMRGAQQAAAIPELEGTPIRFGEGLAPTWLDALSADCRDVASAYRKLIENGGNLFAPAPGIHRYTSGQHLGMHWCANHAGVLGTGVNDTYPATWRPGWMFQVDVPRDLRDKFCKGRTFYPNGDADIPATGFGASGYRMYGFATVEGATLAAKILIGSIRAIEVQYGKRLSELGRNYTAQTYGNGNPFYRIGNAPDDSMSINYFPRRFRDAPPSTAA